MNMHWTMVYWLKKTNGCRRGLLVLAKFFTWRAGLFLRSSRRFGAVFRWTVQTFVYRHFCNWTEYFWRQSACETFFNALLYAITLMLMLYFLRKYIFPKNPDIAFLATILFALHPIHSEVVANIKSRNELLPFLFYLTTLIFSGKYIQSKKWFMHCLDVFHFFVIVIKRVRNTLYCPASALLYSDFASTTQKESALLSSLLRSHGCVYPDSNIHNTCYRSFTKSNGGSIEQPVYPRNNAGKARNKSVFTLEVLRDAFYPWPLSSDYSYNQIEYIQPGNILFIGSVILHLLLIGITIYFFLKRKILRSSSCYFTSRIYF